MEVILQIKVKLGMSLRLVRNGSHGRLHTVRAVDLALLNNVGSRQLKLLLVCCCVPDDFRRLEMSSFDGGSLIGAHFV